MFTLKSLAGALALAASALAAPVENTSHESLGYIVRLKSNATISNHTQWVGDLHARSLNKRSFTGVEKTFDAAGFLGYSGHFDAETLEEIRNRDDVSCVSCWET